MLKPEKYLDSNSEFKQFYLSRIDLLNEVSCLLSISNSSSKEAEKYLSIDKQDIHNIYAGCDQRTFYPSKLIEDSNNSNRNN